jgi:hypothetical protein
LVYLRHKRKEQKRKPISNWNCFKIVVAVLTDNEKISRSVAIGWIEIVGL